MNSETPLFVVRAFPVDTNGRVFVSQRAEDDYQGGLYDVPGGKTDGEDFEEALRREVREETGAEIILQGIIGEVSEIGTKEKYLGREVRTRFYRCKFLGDVIKLSDEHKDYKWVSISEMRDLKNQGLLCTSLSRLIENVY